MSFIDAWIRGFEFSLPSFLLGLIPFALQFALQWFNSFIGFKKNNIHELKITIKELIDVWANMKESAQNIMNFSNWLKTHKETDDEFLRKKIPTWNEGIHIEKERLQIQYNRTIRLIGHLYFYCDGYHLQNKLEDLFWKMKDTDWEGQTYIKSWNDLWKFQNQGTEILTEIKKEIGALSTLLPRPIHWLQVCLHYLDLTTYGHRRRIRVMTKRKMRFARTSFKKISTTLMKIG